MFAQAVGFLFRVLGKPEKPNTFQYTQTKQIREPYPTFFCSAGLKEFVEETTGKEKLNVTNSMPRM